MLQQDFSQLGHAQLPAVAQCKEQNSTKGTGSRGLSRLGAGTLVPRAASRAHTRQRGDPRHCDGLRGPRCPWGAWARPGSRCIPAAPPAQLAAGGSRKRSPHPPRAAWPRAFFKT